MKLLSACTCLGLQVTFECIIAGRGATIWKGTVLSQCENSQILLRHSQFPQSVNNSGVSKVCNTSYGQIVGQSIEAVNETFTSHLLVSIHQNLDGQQVQCIHDNGSHVPGIVGTHQITITTSKLITIHVHKFFLTFILAAPFVSPTDISLTNVGRAQLTFTWSHVSQRCSALYYNVLTFNCGECPNTTTSNSITCHNVLVIPQNPPHFCTLIVQSVVCGNINGINSEPLVILLQGQYSYYYYKTYYLVCVSSVPDVPQVEIIPEYSGKTRKLINLSVNFIEAVSTFERHLLL